MPRVKPGHDAGCAERWRKNKKSRACARLINETMRPGSLALAAQADHHVDAGDLVAGRSGRGLGHHLCGARDVDQSIVAFDEEMVVRGGVGVEIGLRAV